MELFDGPRWHRGVIDKLLYDHLAPRDVPIYRFGQSCFIGDVLQGVRQGGPLGPSSRDTTQLQGAHRIVPSCLQSASCFFYGPRYFRAVGVRHR